MLAWLEDHFLSSKADDIPRSDSPDRLRGGAGSVSGYKFTQNSWLDDEVGAPSRMWGAAWRASPVGTLPPVFLQHNTHSRTVIGMVRRNDGDLNVLMLDPAKHFTTMDLEKPLWQVISCPPIVFILCMLTRCQICCLYVVALRVCVSTHSSATRVLPTCSRASRIDSRIRDGVWGI